MADDHSDRDPPGTSAKLHSDQVSTPILISPPRTRTPPTAETHKANGALGRPSSNPSGPLDSDELAQKLTNLEHGGRHRELTPGSSPSHKRQRVYGDRFIPNREGRDLQAGFSLLHDDGSPATPSKSKKRTPHNELHFQKSKPRPSVHSGPHANIILLQRKRQTELSPPSCGPRCLMTPFLLLYRPASRPMRAVHSPAAHAPEHHLAHPARFQPLI